MDWQLAFSVFALMVLLVSLIYGVRAYMRTVEQMKRWRD